jgi:hypothetical protein
MPFIVHEQLHMPPAIILHRFCSVAALISSSQVQVSFMPPAHFSNFIVQRGTIIIDGVDGAMAGMPACGIEPIGPIEPIIERSNIIVLDILNSPYKKLVARLLSELPDSRWRSLWLTQSVPQKVFWFRPLPNESACVDGRNILASENNASGCRKSLCFISKVIMLIDNAMRPGEKWLYHIC